MTLARMLLALAALAAAGAAQAQITFSGASSLGVGATITTPNWQAAGTAANWTAGTQAVAWPAHAVDDIGLLFCESVGTEAVTLSTANGFAAVPNSPQSTTNTRLTVFWARATSTSMTSPVVNDSGNHTYCQIHTYRNVIASGSPFDDTAGGGLEPDAITIPGVVTTVANTRVLYIASRGNDAAGAAFGAATNSTGMTMTEREDNGTTSGNGGGFVVWDGTQAGTGYTGHVTATVTASTSAFLTIALAPSGGSAPTYVGEGAYTSGTGGVNPAWPAHVANDIGILICETQGNQAITTPTNWAVVSGSPQVEGTTTRLSVFWRRAPGAGTAAPAVADPGNHVGCQIQVYRGVVTTGDPWDATAGGIKSTTALTMPGVVTTVDSTLIVTAASRDNDSAAAAFSAQANASLTGITERSDAGTTDGNGGGFAVWDGGLATAGYSGTTTATVTASENAFLTMALLPRSQLRLTVPGGTAVGDVMVAHVAVRPSTAAITTPAGWTLVNQTAQATGTTLRMATFTRVADLTDTAAGATHTFPVTAGHTGAVASIVSYNGVDTVEPVNAEAGSATASSLTHAAPGVTTTVPNTMLVRAYAFSSAATWTEASGTERADLASETVPSAVGIAMANYEEAQAAAGSSAARSASAANDADVGVTRQLALRPAVHHYSISAPSAVARCDHAQVIVQGHLANHGLAAPRAGVVLSFSTSTTNGVWQAFDAARGDVGTAVNFVPSGSDNGVATYSWSGTESAIQVRLRRATVTANVGINVSDTNGIVESEDATISFNDAALRFTTDGASATAIVGTQISGKPSDRTPLNAANVALYLQAVSTTPAGTCQTLFQNEVHNIEFAVQCNNPVTCATTGLTAPQAAMRNSGGGMTAIQKNNGPVPPTAYTAVALQFSNDANAMAPVAVQYDDAGQVTLYARYTAPTSVTNTVFTAISTSAFVVRPFGLFVDGGQGTSTKDHTSAVLAAAGDPFTMSVTAYRWAAGESDASGDPLTTADITDNGTTPGFAATATVTPVANTAGAAGQLGRAGTCNNTSNTVALAGGTGSAADWCYSEVGNVRMQAAVSDYITGGVNITGGSNLNDADSANGHIGRFKPKDFGVSAASLVHRYRSGSSCAPPSTFTYLGEGLTLDFTLTARNTQGGTTTNYAGSYAKLNPGTDPKAVFVLGARGGATGLTGRTTAIYHTSAPSWSSGVLTLSGANAVIASVARNTPDAPDGPFAASFGIAPVDGDSVGMNTNTTAYDLDADVSGSAERKDLGVSAPLRFGRLRLSNATGSEKLSLQVPVAAQYWDGTRFITNGDDSCTSLDQNQIALTFVGGSTLTACETAVTNAPLTLASGTANITLAAPGGANVGSLLVSPQLGAASGSYCTSVGGSFNPAASASRSYLLGSWNPANPDGDANTSYDDNPAARVGFGVYGARPRNFIFFRENY